MTYRAFCLQNGGMVARESLGARLRALRTSRTCTVAELSRRSGIGTGTISELENGKRDARLDTLFALTTALDAPLGALLSAGDEGFPVSGASVHATLIAHWTTGEERLEVYRARLTPHQQTSPPHANGVMETITVLSGAARIGSAGQVTDLGAGESLHYPGDRPHSFRSIGGDASALLVMHYPLTQKEVLP